MTPKERMLTAMRGGQPDRVPVVARMWKFHRKYYPDLRTRWERDIRGHEEFGTDVFTYGTAPALPCANPIGTKIWFHRSADISAVTH